MMLDTIGFMSDKNLDKNSAVLDSLKGQQGCLGRNGPVSYLTKQRQCGIMKMLPTVAAFVFIIGAAPRAVLIGSRQQGGCGPFDLPC